MSNTLFIVSAIRLSHEKTGLNQVLKKSMLYMVLQQNKCGQKCPSSSNPSVTIERI